MNSLLYYYNNVQKMAAYRQAKWMQRGVKLGENQSVGGSTTAKFVSNPIPIGTDDFTVEFYGSMCGSNVSYASLFNAASPSAGGDRTFSFYSRYYPNNGIYGILFSPDTDGDSLGDQVVVQYEPGDDSKFLVSVTRQGTTVKAYINGELKATKEQSEAKDLGDLQLAIANSSDVGFVRVWNYALSADEIATLYNNGDPAGCVVPKAMRGLEPVEITGSNSYTWTGVDDIVSYNVVVTPKLKYLHKYKVNVSVSNYEAGSPYIYTGSFAYIPAANGTYDIEVEISNPVYTNIPIYGGQNGTDRRLTLTVNSVTPIGLIAEHLPQNIMESRKGPIVEPTAETFEFNIGSPYIQTAVSGRQYPFDCIYRVDYVVEEWDYQPNTFGTVGFLGIGGAENVSGSRSWYSLEQAKVGELQSFLIKMPGSGYPALYIYGGNDNEATTARRLKVTIKGITPVSVPISWLDSAKQFPLSDEYMEPMFQSIGGYDMTANGAPEILYNE